MATPHHLRTGITTGVVAVSLALTGCGGGGGTGPVIDAGDAATYRPALDPASFVDRIDNPYLPLLPGSRWVYEGVEDGGSERVEVVVTADRKEILGIPTVVVRDTVTVDGEVVEHTLDWFAQDRQGNVWYLGEDSKEYENGRVVSREGSWQAGVDGARPGIVMPARPTVGHAYRQEYLAGEAEDLAQVVRLDGRQRVRFGAFDRMLVTREWTPLEPATVEEKFYASGVGLVLERKTAGGEGRVELVEHSTEPEEESP